MTVIDSRHLGIETKITRISARNVRFPTGRQTSLISSHDCQSARQNSNPKAQQMARLQILMAHATGGKYRKFFNKFLLISRYIEPSHKAFGTAC